MDWTKKIREMEYAPNRPGYRILALGERAGRRFFVVDVYGKWPVAYVEAKPGDPAGIVPLNAALPEGEGADSPTPPGRLTYGPHPLTKLVGDPSWRECGTGCLGLDYWGWDYVTKIGFADSFEFVLDLSKVGEGGVCVDSILAGDVYPFADWMSARYPEGGKAE